VDEESEDANSERSRIHGIVTIMNHWTNFKTLMGREIAHKTNAGCEMDTVKGVEKNGEFAVELFIHLIVPRNN